MSRYGTDIPGPSPVAPDRDQPGNRSALLIVDTINPFDFDGGDALRIKAERAAVAIASLRDWADAEGVPAIYVNDNFGEWHSEKSRLVERARPGLAGGRIEPRDRDFFVIKPQFSGFYSTNLAVLLPKLGVRRLILTGLTTEICILFTAADAHMRDYETWVPEDCVAAIDDERGNAALALMRSAMKAHTAASSQAELSRWLRPQQD